MTGYIASEKYIKKEFLRGGVGVPISFTEDIAKAEASRPKNLDSLSQWFEITIPEKNLFIDMNKPIALQNVNVKNCLLNTDFLVILFLKEGRKLFQNIENNKTLSPDDDEKIQNLFEEFALEHYEKLTIYQSGFELLEYIKQRCKTHDLAKATALLYFSGIKGCLYNDTYGERALIYNAHDDIILSKLNREKIIK